LSEAPRARRAGGAGPAGKAVAGVHPPGARQVAGAGALALAVAIPHAGPALAPIVPAVGQRLPVVLRDEGNPGVALTFDDGPHPRGTPAVLEILRERGQLATFFLAGEQVEKRPALAAEIVAAGHRVELHCHRHRNQLRLTPRAILDDAERARAAIEEATGQAIADYRPPYGIFSGAGLAAVRSRGWRPVLWSKWGRDWTRRATAASITGKATDGIRPGDIVLLHDADYYSARNSWERTASALPRICDELAMRGLKSSVLRR
jgi:peptidoglycan-N-acetylglucosamine deacetylase